mmetsp:Transcript_17754/g.36064  ORF Transcript_17754/g.36064 Transcript_17754/m.36064 type:complete len:105 (-) Transcript_17754:334-648(-)
MHSPTEAPTQNKEQTHLFRHRAQEITRTKPMLSLTYCITELDHSDACMEPPGTPLPEAASFINPIQIPSSKSPLEIPQGTLMIHVLVHLLHECPFIHTASPLLH